MHDMCEGLRSCSLILCNDRALLYIVFSFESDVFFVSFRSVSQVHNHGSLWHFVHCAVKVPSRVKMLSHPHGISLSNESQPQSTHNHVMKISL